LEFRQFLRLVQRGLSFRHKFLEATDYFPKQAQQMT
jgi:hypothetical protein